MTSETPTIRSQLRTALIERCQLDTNDPRADVTTLNGFITAALLRFQMANPLGWPWDWIENNGLTLPAGTAVIQLRDTQQAGLTSAIKIREVILRNSTDTWQWPVERVQRSEQLQRFPLLTERGTPRTVAIVPAFYDTAAPLSSGPQMFFAPIPDVDYLVTARMLDPLGYLFTGDSDPVLTNRDPQFDLWADAALEYAACLVYRAHGDIADAIAAKTSFDAEVLRLRRNSNRVRGPGYGENPVADEWIAP